MNNNTQETVQQFLHFLSGRNLTELINLFSDTVDWYIPGDEQKAPWLGVRNNKQEISGFFELLWKNTEPVSAKIDHIFNDDENAVITGEFVTKMLATGHIVESLFCIQMRIQNNKIIRYRLLEDSLAVSKALEK
ncbi:ketosteroid isomerase-like protein [Chryseobacterium vietnamense]|jgi:ketosteroid isomerase-like protein|uniref:Ketosteroid isomerase-like protein n=1 Tax=Chryseobacterium vietnamense TaxID=866785 RepID=A0ACC6J373_9FLAO|nr:nuclear transport factor 2 family protein [Chryseobacterium vietnamense]MDR6457389.1 ketosteroid isomerase-like protein [Chryseobacterium vietnamense]MDR6486140.1 ketosteroid isomerase-like protein [Chryseobacterium vietnamense]